MFCVVICCIIRSKRNKQESFKIEANNGLYLNKTYDSVDNVFYDSVSDAVNTNLQLQDRNAVTSSIISNHPSFLESQSSFIQSSAEGWLQASLVCVYLQLFNMPCIFLVPVPVLNEWGNVLAKCLIDYNTLVMEKEIAKGLIYISITYLFPIYVRI